MVNQYLTLLPHARIVAWYDASEALCTAYVVISKETIDSHENPIDVKPSDNVISRIIESDSIDQLPNSGHLEVTGESVMLGYWDDICTSSLTDLSPSPRTTLLHDWVLFNDHDRLRVLGRNDSIVKIMGRRISLKLIEDTLLKHKSILFSFAAKIESTSTWDTIVAAVIVDDSSLSEEDIIKHCKYYLQSYSVPSHVRLMKSFPLTATGKTDRQQ